MNRAPDSSRLEAFLRDTLKGTDDKFQPFDWSELEVMLKPEQRSIAVPVNRKNMLMIGAAVGILAIIFLIFKLTQYYSSLPAEPETLVDTTQSTFTLVDTTSSVPPVDSSALKLAAAKADSIAKVAAERHKADSLTALAVADSLAKIKVEIVPVVKVKDKKKKTDTTQKVNTVDTTSAKPPVDTTSKPAPQEVIVPAPAVPDTAKKSAPDNNSKKKKTKAKKPVPPPAEPKTDPPAIPSDSLK